MLPGINEKSLSGHYEMPYSLMGFRKVILLFGLLMIACEEKPKTEKLPEVAQNVKTYLSEFFKTEVDEKKPIVGIFKADAASFIKIMRENFLSKYQAKPDEASKQIIEKRIKETDCYLRFSINGLAQMLTLRPGGYPGANSGTYRIVSDKLIDLTLTGNEGSINAKVKLIAKDMIQYSDINGILIFKRSDIDPAKLTDKYLKQFLEMTEIPDY